MSLRAFQQSKLRAFLESPCRARCGSGGGASVAWYSNIYRGVNCFRYGYYDPDMTDWGSGGSATVFPPNPDVSTSVPTLAARHDRTCYRKAEWKVVSTPDPDTLTGTNTWEWTITRGRGSARWGDIVSDESGNQWEPTLEDNANLISRVATSTKITWTWQGTYGGGSTWTQVATLEFLEEYAFDDFLADTVALYGGVDMSISERDTNLLMTYDENGDPDELFGGTHGDQDIEVFALSLSPPQGYWADSEEADIPILSSGAPFRMRVAGSVYVADVLDWTYDSTHPGYGASTSGISLTAGSFVIQNVAEPALFRRAGDVDEARVSATAERKPSGIYEQWVQLSASEVSSIQSDQLFVRKTMGPSDLYDLPDPDFPVPS